MQTSTPTPITKPPSDNKNCKPYIEGVPCGIIQTGIAIVLIALTVVLIYLLCCRLKICNKKEIDETTKRLESCEIFDKSKECEAVDTCISNANNPHEDGAKYRYENTCPSSPKGQVSQPSGTKKEIQSDESTDGDLQQHKSVSDDDTNGIMKNKTKEEGTSRKEDNKSDDYDGRLNQSPESTESKKQTKSVANNATNILGKYDNNGLKSEVISETKI